MSKKPIFAILSVMLLSLGLPGVTSASLVGWWKFDETSGTTAKDSSGNGHDGTLINGPTWAAGYYDGAVSLDGTDDYVQLDIGALVPTLKECTLSTWIKRNTTGATSARVIDFGDGSQTNFDYIYVCPQDGGVQSLRVALVCGNGTWNEVTLTDAAVTTTDWTHIAVSISASAKKMVVYRDGREVGSLTEMVNSVDALGATTNNWLGRSTYAADPYFNGIIDDFRIYNEILSQDRVQKVMMNVIDVSSKPTPKNKAADVRPDVVLGWTPGQSAVGHDVYFGTNPDDVNTASRADPKGVLVSQGQDANTFDPAGLLTLGQIYYWRVDEVNAPSSPGTFKGDLWSFTAEPVAYPVTSITATGSSKKSAAEGPENTINGSGMTGDLHDTNNKNMWLSVSTATPTPAWIQYDFDRVYKLHELWVWNYNVSVEAALGMGAKDTTVEYSADGTTWTKLGDFVFAQATQLDGYAHNTTIPFGGLSVKAVRLTINTSWKSTKQHGLSEVRFLYIPVWAREPQPAVDSNDVDPTKVVFSWRPGREAVSHKVYLGTDPNVVKASTTAVGTSSTPSYTPSSLQLGTAYYWRVDEVNAAEAVSTWAGDVWNFATPDYLVIDGFDAYDDKEGTRIFDIWVDGYGTSTNGSQVGYDTAANGTFGQTLVVHGGTQSMPFAYNNSSSLTTSEATRTFDAAQDWTLAGVKTLVVFFRGVLTNGAGQLYVKINDTKVNYSGDAPGIAAPLWKQWSIDLSSISGLNAVKKLTIGVSGTSAGLLYIDDIRLYKSAPALVLPANPGTANLAAYFPMDGDVKDATNHGYMGTVSSTTFVDSMGGFGKALQFNGTTAYVDMGSTFGNNLIKSLASCTAAVWVNYTGVGNMWQRVFDFGSGTAVYMFLTTRSNVGNAPQFAIRTAAATATANVSGPRALSVGWHHLAGVIDASGATPTMALYIDGDPVRGTAAFLPKDLGATTNNWLGRSQVTADPYFNGTIDDLRIYNRVLTDGEIRYLVGDR